MPSQRTTSDGQPLYKCSRCTEWLPPEAYTKLSTLPRGLSYLCRDCMRLARLKYAEANKKAARLRGRHLSAAARERKNAKDRERYAQDIERRRAKNRAWAAAHKEAKRAYNASHPAQRRNPNYLADYWAANSDRLNAAKKEYVQTERGREVVATCSLNRRAREAQTRSDLTAAQWRLVLRLQNNCCARCGRPFGPDLIPCRDHIMPISAGGDLTLSNVQGLCPSCNGVKGARHTDYRSPQMREAIAQYLGASLEAEETA